MRKLLALILILGMAGIGICDLRAGDYRQAAIGFVFATANYLIFW